ncbi:hypothetical protein ACSDR0_24880 [Streptosporangium sp. G11]|uniref:hypothetical protein n=1 Tax=Streptosporangium sp. G11 TaxID=3436926 RepID=UPI003EBBAB13
MTGTSAVPAASQLTASNRFVEAANGIRYAYRRFGAQNAGTIPLVFLRHFRGNIDDRYYIGRSLSRSPA